MKIELVPLNNITGVSVSGFYNVIRGSDISTGLARSVTDAFLQNTIDYKDYGCIEGKKVKMFYKTGKMFWKLN